MQNENGRGILSDQNGAGQSSGGSGKEQKPDDRAVQSKRRFIENIAHQIRTLSNAIVGFCDLLGNESLTSSQNEYVTEIRQSSAGLISLINTVLDVSRIELGHFVIDVVDCSLEWLMEEIQFQFQPLAQAKGLDFSITQASNLPAAIRTDPVRLKQCLLNVVNNAIKYTESGGVRLDVALERLKNQYRIRFDVTDTGCGIPPDKQKSVFEPYGSTDQANESVLTSLEQGLVVSSGLAMTNYTLRALGGKITLTSTPGRGSCFSLVVPAGVDAANVPSIENAPGKSREDIVDVKKQCSGRILLVEDEPSNRTVLTLLLETLGLDVEAAQDGLEGLGKASEGNYDLILMDIKMPKMNGVEAAEEIHRRGIKTPIIALSAASAGDEDLPLEQDVFDSFLPKPVDSRKLYNLVRKYLCAIEQTDAAANSHGEYDHYVVELSVNDDPVWIAQKKQK